MATMGWEYINAHFVQSPFLAEHSCCQGSGQRNGGFTKRVISPIGALVLKKLARRQQHSGILDLCLQWEMFWDFYIGLCHF